MAVFVLDKRKRPLMPCSEKRARKRLESGRARVHRLIPFAIRLVDRHVSESELQALQIKLDPGSKTTGIALVGKSEAVNAETGEVMATAHVLSLFELLHRGRQISQALTSRRQMRRRRRGTLRYRAPRFRNRANKASGWLTPSLKHRCEKCNTKKAAQDVREFLAKDPKRLERIATRWALFNALEATGLPVTTGSGGLTKCNRSRLGIPKTHALDALCGVGVTHAVTGWWKPTLTIQAMGRGRYQRSRLDRFGFPRGYPTRRKRIKGFQTDDRVIARVTTGKQAGIHFGRVAVRVSGRFNIQTTDGVVQGIAHRHCRVIQRADGYGYSQRGTTSKATPAAPSPLYRPALKGGVSRGSR